MRAIFALAVLVLAVTAQNTVDLSRIDLNQLRSIDAVVGNYGQEPRQEVSLNQMPTVINAGIQSRTNPTLKFRTFKATDTTLRAIEKSGILKRIPTTVPVAIEFRALKDAKISNSGLRALGRALRGLTNIVNVTVEILEAKNVGRDGFVSLVTPLARYQLQNLNLTFVNSKVDDTSMQALTTAVAKKFTLQNFAFTCQRCDSISRRGARALGSLIKSLPTLRQLKVDLQKCRKIGDTSTTALGDALKGNRLSWLELNFKDARTTTKGLKALATSLKATTVLPRGSVTDAKGETLDVSRFISKYQ